MAVKKLDKVAESGMEQLVLAAEKTIEHYLYTHGWKLCNPQGHVSTTLKWVVIRSADQNGKCYTNPKLIIVETFREAWQTQIQIELGNI